MNIFDVEDNHAMSKCLDFDYGGVYFVFQTLYDFISHCNLAIPALMTSYFTLVMFSVLFSVLCSLSCSHARVYIIADFTLFFFFLTFPMLGICLNS